VYIPAFINIKFIHPSKPQDENKKQDRKQQQDTQNQYNKSNNTNYKVISKISLSTHQTMYLQINHHVQGTI
jgi:hypothetical protein